MVRRLAVRHRARSSARPTGMPRAWPFVFRARPRAVHSAARAAGAAGDSPPRETSMHHGFESIPHRWLALAVLGLCCLAFAAPTAAPAHAATLQLYEILARPSRDSDGI